MAGGLNAGALRHVLREPLLHFLLIGAVLFAGYAWLERSRDGQASPNEIRLTLDELAQLELMFESSWQRPPTPDEFNALLEQRIREDVLYREALALGLDKDDTIVRRRMAQKMKFLAEDVAAAREPTTEELRAWFEAHGELFALPPRVSFRHLYFSVDRRRGQARNDAAQALAQLTQEPQDSARAGALADPFMFQDYYGERTAQEIAREFGPGFAQAVLKLAPGSWQGPVESGYGWHLVFVDAVTPGRVPAFEEVETDVKTAWLGEQKAAAWQKAYDEIRARYTVLLPVPPDGVTASATGPAPSSTDTLARDSGAPL
jgi:peptidyl-prolyl cis-trans isomerase C